MTGFTFSDYLQHTMLEKENVKASTSGIGGSDDSIKQLCQELISEHRLQHYQIEQQGRTIAALNDKVEALELHRATQLGQDKIIGFLVGAIVLSLLSLATSIFFKPATPSMATNQLEPVEQVATQAPQQPQQPQ